MFENLSQRINKTIRHLSGRGRLTEENIKESLREIRMALLEADVALSVVTSFIERVKTKAIGEEVLQSLQPGEALVSIVHKELIHILGDEQVGINLKTNPPAVIMMAGLQGSGKTTSTAKLARWLKTDLKKSVLLTSVDVYRPAAIKQLETLANTIEVDFFPSSEHDKPAAIAKAAIAHAKKQFIDVVIVDTAGRLHIDDEMMSEIKSLHKLINPIETLFVVDSMTGQDAANTAKVFNEALELTGVILTKIDGDARGGAALSVRSITGKPIKFIGTGEKTQALEVFHPDRIASRILDMGDVLTLIEEAERNVDQQKAKRLSKKLKKGKGFDLQDFAEQIDQMTKMGGMANIATKLPGMKQLPQAMQAKVNDGEFAKMKAMIQSMTPQERRYPAVIKGSRKKRITQGSGTQVQDLNRLLKQFLQTQKMMKKFSKGGMRKMMRNLQGMNPLGNNLPPFRQ
ncbi:MAG: signal recognition particle protein [Pseudomonadota bacterium]